MNIIDEGDYTEVEDNVYICHGDSDWIVTLLNKSFYIYDENEDRTIELIKFSDVPTHYPNS